MYKCLCIVIIAKCIIFITFNYSIYIQFIQKHPLLTICKEIGITHLVMKVRKRNLIDCVCFVYGFYFCFLHWFYWDGLYCVFIVISFREREQTQQQIQSVIEWNISLNRGLMLSEVALTMTVVIGNGCY